MLLETGVLNGVAEVLVGRQQPEADGDQFPEFPDSAWRGSFSDYRDAMHGTTEAPDVSHFATMWAAAAVAIGRRVWMRSGDIIYPNVYLNNFGSTGDKKTTAQRRLSWLLPEDVSIVGEVGSTEGLADKLSTIKNGRFIFHWEELSSLLGRAHWNGSTLFQFITETFDCPPKWGLAYRKQPVELIMPTPSILTATTPEWFWKNARAEDFFGGFGNRFVHLTGPKKAPLPHPLPPDESRLAKVQAMIARLSGTGPIEAVFSPQAEKLFTEFYCDQESAERSALICAALKRLHVYVRKLAMTYADCEDTLPVITLEQLEASIAVGCFARVCIEKLIDSQSCNIGQLTELERRFIRWVNEHPGHRKREMQQTLSKYCESCEVFNRVFKSIEGAGHIETKQGRVYPSGG